MKITTGKTMMTFPGFDGEKHVIYGIRVTTPELLREAIKALEEAIEAVNGGS